jgi:hypothetical protein
MLAPSLLPGSAKVGYGGEVLISSGASEELSSCSLSIYTAKAGSIGLSGELKNIYRSFNNREFG